MRTTVVVAAVVIVATISLFIVLRLNRAAGQVTDVTGLVTDQSARVNRVLETQFVLVQGLAGQVAMQVAAVERLADVQRELVRVTTRVYRDVNRVLRRFQLLFRRLLRSLRGQLPSQTAALVTSIERGLRQLLSRLRR